MVYQTSHKTKSSPPDKPFLKTEILVADVFYKVSDLDENQNGI